MPCPSRLCNWKPMPERGLGPTEESPAEVYFHGLRMEAAVEPYKDTAPHHQMRVGELDLDPDADPDPYCHVEVERERERAARENRVSQVQVQNK